MSQHKQVRNHVSRRTFIKTGVATAAAAGLPLNALASDEAKEVLPRRPLGNTGENVTILNLGCGRPPEERMLNAVWEAGVRYLDTAASYGGGASERAIAEWLEKTGKRKDLFIVTKDDPSEPGEWMSMIDKRLEALKTDYIDLFFLHGLGGSFRGGGEKHHVERPIDSDWTAAAKEIKKSGKVRHLGFSTHAMMELRVGLLKNAAMGDWVEAIMVAYDPKTVRENAGFNKALDACHEKGIGLICMKEMRSAGNAPEFLPEFKDMGLTPQQAVLHAVWSDQRMASICSDMPSMKVLTDNAEAAEKFRKPMDAQAMAAVIGLYGRGAAGYCNACDGSCARAAGTKAALGDITRALSYYEQDGRYAEARAIYRSLSAEERDWTNADLAAATQACHCKLDFAQLLPRAAKHLA